MAYHGVTQVQLAADIGVHQSDISKIIKGVATPAKHLAALVAWGIPASLLPEPGSAPSRRTRPEPALATRAPKPLQGELP